MASDSTDWEVRSTLSAADGQRNRRRDERGRTSPSLLQLARQRSMQKVKGRETCCRTLSASKNGQRNAAVGAPLWCI